MLACWLFIIQPIGDNFINVVRFDWNTPKVIIQSCHLRSRNLLEENKRESSKFEEAFVFTLYVLPSIDLNLNYQNVRNKNSPIFRMWEAIQSFATRNEDISMIIFNCLDTLIGCHCSTKWHNFVFWKLLFRKVAITTVVVWSSIWKGRVGQFSLWAKQFKSVYCRVVPKKSIWYQGSLVPLHSLLPLSLLHFRWPPVSLVRLLAAIEFSVENALEDSGGGQLGDPFACFEDRSPLSVTEGRFCSSNLRCW